MARRHAGSAVRGPAGGPGHLPRRANSAGRDSAVAGRCEPGSRPWRSGPKAETSMRWRARPRASSSSPERTPASSDPPTAAVAGSQPDGASRRGPCEASPVRRPDSPPMRRPTPGCSEAKTAAIAGGPWPGQERRAADRRRPRRRPNQAGLRRDPGRRRPPERRRRKDVSHVRRSGAARSERSRSTANAGQSGPRPRRGCSGAPTGGELDGRAGVPATMTALEVDPHGRIYAATAGDGMFASEDGGESWGPTKLGAAYLTDVAAAAGARVVLAASPDGVFSSSDGGSTWRLARIGPVGALCPAGSGSWAAGGARGVLRAEPASKGWTPSNSGLTATSVFSLAILSGSPGSLLAGTARGIFRSDTGEAWKRLPGAPEAVEFYAITRASESASDLLVGSSGEIGRSFGLDGSWSWLPAPAVFGLTGDPAHPGSAFAATRGATMYTEDGGITWQASSKGLTRTFPLQLALDRRRPPRSTPRRPARACIEAPTAAAHGNRMARSSPRDRALPRRRWRARGSPLRRYLPRGVREPPRHEDVVPAAQGAAPIARLCAPGRPRDARHTVRRHRAKASFSRGTRDRPGRRWPGVPSPRR